MCEPPLQPSLYGVGMRLRLGFLLMNLAHDPLLPRSYPSHGCGGTAGCGGARPRPDRTQQGQATDLAHNLSHRLVEASERHRGNLAFGFMRRLAIIVRGGLPNARSADPPDGQERAGSSGEGRRGASSGSKPDGPPGAKRESRLWERARTCVSRITSEEAAYLFLAKAEGQGEVWYQAVASLLAVRYPNRTFNNASKGTDDDSTEASCLLACGPVSIRLVFIDACCELGHTPSQVASELRWTTVLPEDHDPGAFQCDIHNE
ncbi:hypothetical protein 2 [Wenzhou crab virus 5]|uniref:hypothetical protein 2 n=1 Tax=Wenzhou crab virus 5 TaxID=1923562 RepID=UPI00090AD616|nr:hypothetical protein 2 [Wenzhou crab virus 5]APG76066.1 hypothetical protein 2 [Wenzhou crab virus 5]